jgi:hypothetical protein
MSIEFEVGKQVVCIKDNWQCQFDHRITMPIKDGIYTIREINADGEIAFRFEEILNPVITFWDCTVEPSFKAYCFRPVRTTNIDVFTEMLNPSPTKTKQKELEYEH